jgi:hypothetical protein
VLDSRYFIYFFWGGGVSHQRPTDPFCVFLFSLLLFHENSARAHKNSTTRNKMAFSMTSALSSRVSATTSSLRTQRVQKRQSASFKCNAYDEAEIDKRYPQGGSVYKVCFSFFSRSLSSSLSLFLSLSLCRLSRDTNDDNATFARRRRRRCFFAKSSISLNFDRSFFSFLPVSLRRYEIFGGDEFFFLFFSKEEERKRERLTGADG